VKAHAVAGRQQAGRFARGIEQRERRAPDEVPSSRRVERVHACLPGGWHLIGRTPLALFDPARESPCLLAPGDRVRFRAIDAEEFARLAERGA
jgi:hypothetical protein